MANEILKVNWEDKNNLETGKKLVTIIGLGRALQISDARIMKEVMEFLAQEGYGKLVETKEWNNDPHELEHIWKFEPIKVAKNAL